MGPPETPQPAQDEEEEEPRLKYQRLEGDVPHVLRAHAAARLCVSDKLLALGTASGSVHLLDYAGNEVKCCKEHTAPVADLCFDASAEYLASCSSDGGIVVMGLYSGELLKYKYKQPITTVALDPRYGQRKTREFVYGTSGGALVLSSKGWLGNRETVLVEGRGPILVARMAGTLLAWAGDTGIRVYDTSNHSRVGKLPRPPSAAVAGPATPCTLYWLGERELYSAWGRQVMVVRVVDNPAAPASAGVPTKSLQILTSFQTDYLAGGAAPFGPRALAVLALTPPPAAAGAGAAEGEAAGSSASGEEPARAAEAASGSSAPRPDAQQIPTAAEIPAAGPPAGQPGSSAGSAGSAGAAPPLLCLKLLSRDGRELASDAIDALGHGSFRALPPPLTPAQICSCRLEVFYTASASEAMATAGPAGAAGAPAGAAGAISRGGSGSGAATPAASRPLTRSSSMASTRSARSAAASLAASPPRAQLSSASTQSSPEKPPPAQQAQQAAQQAAQQVQRHQRRGSVGSAGTAPSEPVPLSAQPSGQVSAEDSWASTPSPLPLPTPPGTAPSAPSGAGAGAGPEGEPGSRVPQEGEEDPILQYKWWRDGDEPQYYMVTPLGIVVGRPRDGNDRITWLLERRRFRAALTVATVDRTVKPGVRERVGEEYLQSLMGDGHYEEAAALCPDVLRDNALAWERWVYTFAQLRQLPALAPFLPTDAPRLKPATYDMVLRAFLLAPADHARLLELVRRLPADAYSARQLQDAVLYRLRSPGGETPALLRVAAQLHTQQGQHEAALQVFLRIRDDCIFDYVARHAMVPALAPYAAELVDADEVRGTSLLVEHHDEIPPASVVSALEAAAQAAPAAAAGTQGGTSPEAWRRRLHTYLDWLFQRDPAAGAEFASLQVELYAEFEPGRLLHFLMLSPSYPLDHAYQVCEQQGLVREMVYVLGRMGSADKALLLIVQDLRDVEQAVEFVQLQRDDELWGLLITLALGDPELTGALLDHAGGYIDPLRVVGAIPPGLAVPRLRARLVRIITDFRTQMCLQQGCHAILRTDCIALANRLYRLLREALPQVHMRSSDGLALAAMSEGASSGTGAGSGGQWALYDTQTGRLALEGPPAFLTQEMLPVEVPSPDAGSATPRGGQQEPPPPLVWVGCAPPASPPGSGARSAGRAGGGGKGGGSPSGVGKGIVTKSPASASKGGGRGRRKGRGGKEGGEGGALSKGEARRATPVLV